MIQRVGRCLAAAILAISAGVGLAAGDPTPAASRVNVLLVCVDDLKPAIGCYGDALAKTPNIDRLAARGVRFERAYCNQAVCSPSRNALLTGFRPQSLGIYDLATNFRRAAPTVRTLPQLFRDGGFHASALGKIFHVGHGNHDDEASWDEPLFRGKTVQYQLPENRGPSREEARFEGLSPEKLPRGSATESARVDDEAYDDGRIAAEANPGGGGYARKAVLPRGGIPPPASPVRRPEAVLGPPRPRRAAATGDDRGPDRCAPIRVLRLG